MITIRTSTDITEDRRVVLILPPETPMGKADLVVTVASHQHGVSQGGSLISLFGTVRGGDPRCADNDRIDADLARAYDAAQE